MKIIAVIPAHLASVRFPRKVLFQFHGLPMIEHVRRRALLTDIISDVYVATCDKEISDVVQDFGGKVIITSNTHTNGTSRVAEAIQEIECTHVILLQGDEPLLLPKHLADFVRAIQSQPDVDAWNATGPLEDKSELERHSFVKCAVSRTEQILYCFRRSPCFSDFNVQKVFIRKILGMIAYRKIFLMNLIKLSPAFMEEAEFIEQMRIIENGYSLKSVPVSPSLPSVNEANEADVVLNYIRMHPEQALLLEKILY